MLTKIKKLVISLPKDQRYNLIELLIGITLITAALIMLNDWSFPLFGLGIIILSILLLKIINNK